LPSSPHWVPITTTVRPTSASNGDQQQQPDDHDGKSERTQVRGVETRDGREPASPRVGRDERQQPLDDEVEREARKKIRPGQSLKPPDVPLLIAWELARGRAGLLLQKLQEIAVRF